MADADFVFLQQQRQARADFGEGRNLPEGQLLNAGQLGNLLQERNRNVRTDGLLPVRHAGPFQGIKIILNPPVG